MSEPEERNKAAMRRFVEQYQTGGDVAALRGIRVGYVHRPQPDARAAWRSRWRPGHLLDVPQRLSRPSSESFDQIAEGDKVVTRKAFHGTHRGSLFGVAPTGNAVRIDLIDIVRFQDGQIVGHWNVIDQLGLLRQIGAYTG